ncbi:two-component system chemotaxis response regulator CheB [Archangium gephyra]|uniref:Protein-glutamate methylesterase/protein-glutamine glutaminase n=1 Tax=Archangium gephyra TaxID=48 RepID=A0AAC8QJ18_9BACT|nr:chemotaxis response regulator protein-glutamate methylesterase [Archangium gephyra]AKJ08001.1 Chemotaxis response regulator protein-glutamate methylesterase CheB [Archangium gephyra]REG29744.1 two-component system chemotaxis response regulator CheB [Archangium gephyra]
MAAVLRVLVVDDSAVVRQGVLTLLENVPGMVVEVASDPLIAKQKMKSRRPDVILLDLEMPRMDGLTFLRELMREQEPVPVVVCSGLAGPGTETAVRALQEGALEIIPKPQLGVGEFLRESRTRLVQSLRDAARARSRLVRRGTPMKEEPERPERPPPSMLTVTTDRVVAVGASTGGTEALRQLLERMPPDCPGIVIVQHMPEQFTSAFAKRLHQLCRIEVKEAEQGDQVQQGRALIAPGNRHLRVRRSGGHYQVELMDGGRVSGHKPSVDVLFQSVARAAGENAIGVLLTGMGEDGADGLLAMKQAGADTLAQDEASCVVFGMPRAAIQRGAVDEVVSITAMTDAVLRRARRFRAH